MQTRIHHDSAALVAAIAATFAAYSREGRPVHIALSGGSTPKALYQALAAAPWRDKIAWHNLHLWWGDERCVPPADPESNYGEAARYLLDHVPVPPENIHRMRGEADANSERARYAADLAAHLPDGRFDWTILGIGEDGHTASLFPGATDYTTSATVDVASHPTSGQTRLTLTAPLIARSKHISYLAVGAGKAAILRAIAEGGDYPAARIRAENGNTEYHLDRLAADQLP